VFNDDKIKGERSKDQDKNDQAALLCNNGVYELRLKLKTERKFIIEAKDEVNLQINKEILNENKKLRKITVRA